MKFFALAMMAALASGVVLAGTMALSIPDEPLDIGGFHGTEINATDHTPGTTSGGDGGAGPIEVIPEPASALLIALGLGASALAKRRGKKS